MTGTAFFENVADALASFLPPDLRRFSSRRSSRNLKVWYGDEGKEHYEAQFVSGHALSAAKIRMRPPVLEIGFHTEYADAARNETVLERLDGCRTALGPDATAAAFIGGSDAWRRLSELWNGPELADEASATEAAERLADYITTIEPSRRKGA